jgi:hypothetical protein
LSLRGRISDRGNPFIRHCEVASAAAAIYLLDSATLTLAAKSASSQ